jgi:Tfp pilus assembly protein PilZ
MEDRRQYRQPLIHHQVQLQFPETAIRMEATAIDISYGGIGLHATKRLPVGQEVVVRIGLIDSEKVIHYESVAGNVRWCRARGFGYAAGIEFEGLDPDLHPRLIAYLEQTELFKETIYHNIKGCDQLGEDVDEDERREA